MTKEEKTFLIDLAAFIADKIHDKAADFDSVMFTIAHDVEGYGKPCFLPRTNKWSLGRIKKRSI